MGFREHGKEILSQHGACLEAALGTHVISREAESKGSLGREGKLFLGRGRCGSVFLSGQEMLQDFPGSVSISRLGIRFHGRGCRDICKAFFELSDLDRENRLLRLEFYSLDRDHGAWGGQGHGLS